MRKTILLSLVVFLILGLVQIVIAQGNDNTAGTRPQRNRMQSMQGASGALASTNLPSAVMLSSDFMKLNLTDEQKASITSIYTEYQKTVKPAATALNKANKEFRTALTTKDIDDSTINAKMKTVKAAEETVITINLTYWAKYREVLSADQLSILNQANMMRNNNPGARAGNRGNNRPANADNSNTVTPAE